MLNNPAKQDAFHWHHRRIIRSALLLSLSIVSFAASASQIFYSPLAKAADSIETLVKGKVRKVDKTVQYKPLRNGKKIETSTHFSYQVEVSSVLYGDAPLGTVQIGHSSFVPIVYNDEGTPVTMFSPILEGSGLENSLQEGREYLLSIGKIADATTGEIPLYRAELPEKEVRLLELIHESHAWKLARQKLPDELPRITAYRFDPESRRLLLFQGTTRIIYSIQGAALLQFKGYENSGIRVNHLDTDNDHLQLLFNQELQGTVGYGDFRPLEETNASRQ